MTPSQLHPNPESSAGMNDLETRVNAVLEKIRPSIKEDGGDIKFLGIDFSGVVKIEFLGACIGCPSSTQTLHHGIERRLKERIPEVTGVEAVEGG